MMAAQPTLPLLTHRHREQARLPQDLWHTEDPLWERACSRWGLQLQL